MSIRAKVYATRAEAAAEIAIEDSHRRYPRTSRGLRSGSGIFADSITTASTVEPIELEGGGWGVPAEALTAGTLDASTARDVSPKRVVLAIDAEPVEEPLREGGGGR